MRSSDTLKKQARLARIRLNAALALAQKLEEQAKAASDIAKMIMEEDERAQGPVRNEQGDVSR